MDSASKLDIVAADRIAQRDGERHAEVAPHQHHRRLASATSISGEQVRSLPLEANNVVGLLSLQPGAVYVPNAAVTDSRTGAVLNIDPRSGAVSGGRADQSNVTLDGIDVNDPQFGTAYSSAVRVTLDSLQEFRVSTSNYGADSGRSSGAQVSLVTSSGTNDCHGAGQLGAAQHAVLVERLLPQAVAAAGGRAERAAEARQEDLRRLVRRPVKKDKLFFFGNYERLTEDSETPRAAQHPVDVDARRRADLPCADPAAVPGGSGAGLQREPRRAGRAPRDDASELATVDPLRHRPEQARVSTTSRQYPDAERPRHRRLEPRGLSLRRADQQRVQHVHRPRRLPAARTARPSSAASTCRTTRSSACRSIPGAAPNTTRTGEEPRVRHRLGLRALLVDGQHIPVRRDADREDIVRPRHGVQVDFRNIDPILAQTATSHARHPDPTHRRRRVVGEGGAHVQVRRQPAVHARRQLRTTRTRSTSRRPTARGWMASARPTCPAGSARSRRRRRATRCPAVAGRAPRPTATR